jgi:hypothetical protein
MRLEQEELQRDKSALDFKLNHVKNDQAACDSKRAREQDQLTKFIHLKSELKKKIELSGIQIRNCEEVI